MNIPETKVVLATLKAVAPHIEVKGDTIRAWHEVFADIPGEAVLEAARVWIRTRRGWPWPAEIREIIAERAMGLPSAEEAWLQIQALMRTTTSLKTLPEPVYESVRAIGGRTALYHADDPTWLRKEFIATYGTFRKKSIVETDLGEAVRHQLDAASREAIGDGR